VTARRHHYVWQKYLEPWTDGEGESPQLWWLRRDKAVPIRIGTKNVAVERDFYRLPDLDPRDAQFVRDLLFQGRVHPKLRELNEGWIARFENFFTLHRAARSLAQNNPAALALLEESLIGAQEDEYQKMEGNAVEYIAALQAGNVDFFRDPTHATRFLWFLAHQYFRTKAMREGIRATFRTEEERDRFERMWPILRYAFATNVGWSIFAERRAVPLQVFQAPPNTEFITGDQPVLNTHGAFVEPRKLIEEFEFFYPVSPSRAAILSGHSIYQGAHGTVLDPFRVAYFNQTIELGAHEQLFAQSEDVLKALMPTFCAKSRAL
jgi:hypothetical protein